MLPPFDFAYDAEDFSLDLCVFCGQVFRWRRVGEGHWIGVEGDFWFDVQASGPSNLAVQSNGDRSDFEKLFRFDWSGVETRKEIISRGPEIGPYIEKLPGLRMMRPSCAVETFFSFLCTPNNHLSRITSMIETLGSFGTPMESKPELFRFPRLERLASIQEIELRERGFGYRAATIPKAAQELLVLGGAEYLNRLRGLSYEEVHEELRLISGVGPKLADCIALYALNLTHAVPIDTHIWQAATRIYFPDWKGSQLSHVKYREVGKFMRERFGELAGWAHQYLFFENVLNWRSRKLMD